jgi:hypothetical protein
MPPVKNSFAFRRLAALLLVLTFVVGLPVQGTAMVAPGPAVAGGETPVSDGCAGCDQERAIGMACPTVICLGFSAITLEPPELRRQSAAEAWASRHESGVGVARPPDPHPPRA